MAAQSKTAVAVGLITVRGCLCFRIFCYKSIIYINIKLRSRTVWSDNGKAGTIDRETQGSSGCIGYGNSTIPVVCTSAAGIVNGPVPFVRYAVVLSVYHGQSISRSSSNLFYQKIIIIYLFPVITYFNTSGEHWCGILIACHLCSVNKRSDGVTQRCQL